MESPSGDSARTTSRARGRIAACARSLLPAQMSLQGQQRAGRAAGWPSSWPGSLLRVLLRNLLHGLYFSSSAGYHTEDYLPQVRQRYDLPTGSRRLPFIA